MFCSQENRWKSWTILDHLKLKCQNQCWRNIQQETSGGFLPFPIPLFAGLSAAEALTGGISAAVKTANESKAQLQAQK